MKKAHIDREGCIGCGLCADTCPEVFLIDEEGKAQAFADISPEYEECAEDTAAGCPAGVIAIETIV